MSGVSTTLNEALERAVGKPAAGLRFLNRHEAAELLPYEEIHRRALDVAGRLHAAGVRRGERVALVYPTSPEFIAALFGALLAGAVPVPLYPPVRLGRLAEYLVQTKRLLHVSGAVLVLADPKVRRVLGEAVASVRPRLGCRTLQELPSGVPTSVGVSPTDLALVQFSSGTTVDPKPVALSHRAVKAQVDILNALWPRDAGLEPSGVSWLPLYHDMGLIGCVFTAVSYPGTLTLLPPEAFIARPALWLRAISRYRAMISVAPNFGYALAKAKIKDEELEGVDLSSWLLALNGAEAVAPSVLRGFSDRFERWGFRREAMTPVYGLSEAALAVTFSHETRSLPVRRFARASLSRGIAEEAVEGRELASVGRPLSGFSVRVTDDSGRDQPEGRIGRIFVRGPSLMDGYLGAPEATAAVLKDGWLDTGDLGFLLEGELYLTGRAKDLLIVRGRNHAPEEVEQAVEGIPGLRPGCAVAVSYLGEEAEGERLVLFVERARDRKRKETDAEIAGRCRREVRIATGLSADEVRVLEPGTIPRTSSGKKRRGETLRRHLEGRLLPPEKVSPLKLLRAMARSRAAFRNAKRETN
ncbi:MAG TPA: fatty acyl-AMP ligase [Thermoanaerobaculia bacterium]|nr:fatty acyl-AMP ligase [Thermoanaerobaculia bacterium]